MSKKKQEWFQVLSDVVEPTKVNDLCRKCTQQCKQHKAVRILCCPLFIKRKLNIK